MGLRSHPTTHRNRQIESDHFNGPWELLTQELAQTADGDVFFQHAHPLVTVQGLKLPRQRWP